MGKRGPKKTPLALVKLRGNPGKRALPRQDVQPAPLGHPPEELRGRALDEWKRITPELRRLGLLSKLDRAALAAYCQAWADLAWAMDTLAREGRVIENPSGAIVAHPAVQVKNAAVAQIRSLSGEFGLSPAARASLEILDVAGEGKRDEERFFGRRA
jgi:P27 family predicted phage terminase small subunit